MKNKLLLFLVFISFIGYSQTNPARFVNGVQITGGQPTETSPTQVTTTTGTGLQGKADPVNLPVNISPQPLNYSIINNKLGEHLKGIDNRFGQIVQTTAGVTNRIYFTGVTSTITAGTFYTSSASGKGAMAGVTQTVSNDDNVKSFFTQDVISIAQPSTTTAPPGNYSGQLSVMVSDASAQERFTIEIYKTNNGGTPIASGITGAPVGNLGVTVVAILDSGILDLSQNSVSNITVSGLLSSTLSLNTGERLRYHVSSQKIGTAGNAFTFSLFYGSDYNSYYDVPVASNTDTTLNKSLLIPGITTTDALNNISVNKENTANKQNSLSPDGSGVKFPTVDAVNKAIYYVTPEEYGAVGDGVTDDKTAIQNAVNSGKPVKLGAKIYLVGSSISMPFRSSISGLGELSRIRVTGDYSAFNIIGADVSIFSLALLGNGSGVNTNGIYVDGGSPAVSSTVTNLYLHNLYINGFANAGILFKGSLDSNFAPTCFASDITIAACDIGIDLQERAEYSSFSNIILNQNNIGVRINGGNNNFVGGQITSNNIGVHLTGSGNDGHSVMSGVAINHNTVLVKAENVLNGYLFNGCMLYAGDIQILNSALIKFSNCDFSVANFQTNLSTNLEISGSKFLTNIAFNFNYLSAGITADFKFFNNTFLTPVSDDYSKTSNKNITAAKIGAGNNNPTSFVDIADLSAGAGYTDLLGLGEKSFKSDEYGYKIKTNSSTGKLSIHGVDNGVQSGELFALSRLDGKASFLNPLTAASATVDSELATFGQVKAIRPYKVWAGTLNQSGTSAPTPVVYENTIGDIVWTRITNGMYWGTLTGAFPEEKTYLSITPSSPTGSYSIYRNGDNTIVVQTKETLSEPFPDTDGKLFRNSIEIRVYNFVFLLLPYSMIRRRKKKLSKQLNK